MNFKALFTVILTICSYCSHAQSEDTMFTIVVKKAYNKNWQEYLIQNLKYPKTAVEKNIQGRVTVRFVVEKDGSISNAAVVRGKELGHGLPEEALRVVKGSPKWEPAKQEDGYAVRSFMSVPITFQLADEEKEIAAMPQDIAGLSTTKGIPVQPKPEPQSAFKPDENHIYYSVQQRAAPTFDLALYLNKNLKYPKEAVDNDVYGKVVVQFVVEKDGSIGDVKILRGKELGHGLPGEAIRVVKSMPKWKPGKQDGKIVRSYFTQAIVFSPK